ncbi:MAG: hypothetical protein PV344_04380, partial [Anaplasma sp.]|nr:hypothetical protein [Anaplasma sp.]
LRLKICLFLHSSTGYPKKTEKRNKKKKYRKRLNFRKNLIFSNFANRLRFAKNRSREQFGQYVDTTEAILDSRKLEHANNFKFSTLARFAKL